VITFRPIEVWPRAFTKTRKVSQFRADWVDTLAKLKYEIDRLQGRSVVIQTAIPERQIRQDGMPFLQAQAAHPGVIVSFQSLHGPLSYPCDTYLEWKDNVRAIALSLEALRAVDRHGVTQGGEQYVGFKALPQGAGNTESDEAEKAARLLCTATGKTFSGTHVSAVMRDRKSLDTAYQEATRRVHPDAGGDNQAMADVNKAYAFLKARMGT
jgi:hypothetical protein